MVDISENAEAAVILVENAGVAATAFILATPLPPEWKAPLAALTTTISAAVLVYWKAKINVSKAPISTPQA